MLWFIFSAFFGSMLLNSIGLQVLLALYINALVLKRNKLSQYISLLRLLKELCLWL